MLLKCHICARGTPTSLALWKILLRALATEGIALAVFSQTQNYGNLGAY